MKPALTPSQIAKPETKAELVDYFRSPLGELAAGMEPSVAFASLTPNAKAFVMALVNLGGANQLRAARMAGYTGNDNVVQVTATRLAANPRVQAAVMELAMGLAKSSSFLAIAELVKMIENSQSEKTKLSAISKLITLIGIEPDKTVNMKHTIEVAPSTKEQVDDIIRMAREIGIDPRKLLGRAGITIDAEFEVAGTSAGLDDLL